MSGKEDGMKSTLSFCTIAHQMVLDLSCLPVIYSTIIETDRTLKTKRSEAVRGFTFSASGVSSDFFIWQTI
jgi:hypothetical protein